MRAHPRLAVAVLASFMAGGLVPHAALVSHDHAGGGAPHVHPFPLAHQHDGEPPHVHPHPHPHAAPTDPTGPAVAPARHVHRQAPFQLADRAVAPPLVRADRVTPAPPAPLPAATDCLSPVARSRGPPPSLAR
jgi:hypothetical protein